MTWTARDEDPIQVATEQYLYWREQGHSILKMINIINGTGNKYGRPADRNGDETIFWLARIWDSKLAAGDDDSD